MFPEFCTVTKLLQNFSRKKTKNWETVLYFCFFLLGYTTYFQVENRYDVAERL